MSGVSYIGGICRDMYRRIGDDLGEMRSSTIGGIGAVSLGSLPAEAIVAPHAPASDIV